MKIEWDQAKNEINKAKHGIDFETTEQKVPTRSFVSSLPDLQPGEKGNYLSKLSAEKRKELQKLSAKPDREIDLTDIPEIREIPSDAVIGRFYRPKKSTVTIRLDSDVLSWLKATGEGYQTRINAYLREMMQRNR